MKKIGQLLGVMSLCAMIFFGYYVCTRSKNIDEVVIQKHCKYGRDIYKECKMSPTNTKDANLGIEAGETVGEGIA